MLCMYLSTITIIFYFLPYVHHQASTFEVILSDNNVSEIKLKDSLKVNGKHCHLFSFKFNNTFINIYNDRKRIFFLHSLFHHQIKLINFFCRKLFLIWCHLIPWLLAWSTMRICCLDFFIEIRSDGPPIQLWVTALLWSDLDYRQIVHVFNE